MQEGSRAHKPILCFLSEISFKFLKKKPHLNEKRTSVCCDVDEQQERGVMEAREAIGFCDFGDISICYYQVNQVMPFMNIIGLKFVESTLSGGYNRFIVRVLGN